jgi:hypothetical protein
MIPSRFLLGIFEDVLPLFPSFQYNLGPGHHMLSYALFINYLSYSKMQESCREIRTIEVLENLEDDFGQQIVDNIVFPPE